MPVGSVLAWWVGKVIRGMRFPSQGEGGGSISHAVLQAFERGCALGLRGSAYEGILIESQALPWNLRAFFNEGHAMGSAGRAACSLRRLNPELSTGSSNYQVMRFVGYGFWNGVAAAYPVPSLTEADSYWQDVPQFRKYRLLMSNGFGFSTVLFAGAFDDRKKHRFLAIGDVRRREAVFHGVGRVLWFLYLNNFKALRAILDEHESVSEPMTVGLGLAIAFTQVAAPDHILRAIGSFPESRQLHLIRGAGIALQVHAGNDPECRYRIEQGLRGETREWYEGACRASAEAGDGAEWYPKYHEMTKQFAAPQLIG